jgi:hypothetical protein
MAQTVSSDGHSTDFQGASAARHERGAIEGGHMSRPFADVVRDLAGGKIYEDLGTQLGEIVSAVLETGKAGALSLSLSIKPNSEGSVLVTAAVKQKIPEPTTGSTLFFATTTGSLLRNDPRQGEMNLRDVKAEDKPLREAVNA